MAWTLLYSAMGYASLRAYRAGASQLGMGLYAAQLLANFAWTPIFFEHHNISLAATDMTGAWGLWGLTIWNGWGCARTSQSMLRRRLMARD